MNNGKVRIYELSKELNLDNREILEVCDQLSIPVKSHSSTISEAEAARIRSAAEKYQSQSSSTGKSVSSSSASMTQSRQGSTQPPVKKQQILEIRRNRPAVEPPKRPEVQPSTAAQPAPPAVSPPRPVAPPTAAAAPRPVAPVRPTTSPEGGAKPVSPVEPAPSEPAPVVEAPAEVTAPEPAPAVATKREAAPPQPPVEAPALVGPPAKPAPTKAPASRPATSAETPSASPNRPVLKKAGQSQGDRQTTPREGAAHPARPVKPSEARSNENSRPIAKLSGSAVVSTPEAEEVPVLRAKPVLELRRKPVRPGAVTEGESTPAAKVGVVEVGVPELKRPAPPRTNKRGKSWEDEEEEQETPKAAKGAVKGKRRANLVDDDEDIDLEEILEESASEDSGPTIVSLSLARPPKPKSRPGQVKPVAAAPTQKKKSTSSAESRQSRRDRREQETREKPEIITLTGGLTVSELADMLVVPDTEIIRTLFMKGIMTTVNQVLDVPTATMVAEELGVLVETGTAEAEAKKVTEMLDASDLENLQRRPPVVTIMGHVDHGKTTLLDSIRKTKVAAGEAGGITQHIGAYHVDVEHNGKTEQIVFLDTPGHEAFTAMRARGARVTDIAILVVAADDGVRPQTIEAISHAKAAGVPIVVAINKIDKPEAQPDRVKQELTEFGLVAEEWGGDTIMVPVSALTGENLDTLLEMLLLVAEVEDLYANPDRPAKGTVIEANLDKARGPVATLLIQNGTLRVGDVLVAGSALGKVRAMIDDRGKRVEAASPSFAVEVLGLSDVPAAGDEFEVYTDEKEARAIAHSRAEQQRLSRLQQAMASRRVSLSSLSAQAQEGDLKELNLILKADVQGSVEAILAALQQLPQKEVQVRVLLAAPGEITETDVDLAAASNAVIIGFNTTFASGARQAADEAGVDVRDYNVIYHLLDDVQGAMEGLLEPELVEEPLGQAEVRAVFQVGRGAVAGCYIQSGKAVRNCRIRVRRGGEVVFEGNLDSLKRVKDDVKEVNAGYECGIGVDNYKDWEVGDIIETFRLVTKRRTLSA